ncbi:hypothetical protein PDE_07240 [Penicillium oxalicum 114-2]|uniref:Zn(2)-C6 fungal-type domain-containing protein n=1 Tax=Penicillium oxalicum (strain 114-2 / CGMCC 5302) TaxID=933388 RepID=S7ZNN1_PENO1|nr:hypothetical protein PDE_07240 [Penicillium oxalicum 114-2]
MSSELGQGTGPNSKLKRGLIDADDDGRANAPDDSAQPKRQRVSRACDNCRTKKDKCDGARPVCSTCASLGRQCTYKTNPKKRGLPTGYIRSLELLWGLVFQKIRGSEDVMRALMKSTNLLGHLAAMGKEAEGSDTLLASFKNSMMLRDIERMLVVLEQPQEDREQSTCPPDDAETPLDVDTVLASPEAREWQIPTEMNHKRHSPPRAAQQSPADVRRSHRSQEAGVQTLPSTEMSSPIRARSGIEEPSTTAGRVLLELPPNVWSLLDVYFTYTQCWLPILEKHDMLRTAYQYTDGPLMMSSDVAGSGDHAALWAILALATFQYAANKSSYERSAQSRSGNAAQLFHIARSLIPAEGYSYELGHVQALLILSLINLGQHQWNAAWMLVGQAIRIAQILRLDQPSFEVATHSITRTAGRAQHVFLACFLLETLTAEQTSQLPCLRKGDLARVGTVSEDGLEEWHPWEDQTGFSPSHSFRLSMQRGPLHALSTFNHLISLVSILNDLCFIKRDPTASRAQLDSLQIQLHRWVSSLPRSSRIELQNRQSNPPSPHVFSLEILYRSTVMSLNMHIASREGDNHLSQLSHRGRAVESSQALYQLLHFFMDTYSCAAATPIFGMILSQCLRDSVHQNGPGNSRATFWPKLESLNSHLRQMWMTADSLHGPAGRKFELQQDYSEHSESQTPPRQVLSTSAPHHSLSSTNFSPDLDGHSRRPMNSMLATPWLRNTSGLSETSYVTMTPTSSLASMAGVLGPSAHTGHPKRNSQSTEPSLSLVQESALNHESDIPYGGQYSTYAEPSLGHDPFTEVDDYGSVRRQAPQRIAPDLDALFDELASLDGAEK